MLKTPVVLFVFNRPECAKQLLSALVLVQPSQVFIIADGPREGCPEDVDLCAQTRAVFNQISWPCKLTPLYSDKNIGCKNSIPNGLNRVFEEVEECIILEDDCIPQTSFFFFCEELLERYRNNNKIITIGGHRSDGPNELEDESYYFSKYPSVWGWATWKDKWKKFDLTMSQWPALRSTSWLYNILKNDEAVIYWRRIFDKMQNEIDTWDYALVYSSWLNNMISIRSKVNMINNIGFGNAATHTTSVNNALHFAKSSNINFPLKHPANIAINEEAEKRIEWVSFSGMDKRILNNIRARITEKRAQERGKVLHVATYDELGGAARATQRIYQALKLQIAQCEMFVLHKTGNDYSIKKPQQIDAKTNLKLAHDLLTSYRNQKQFPNKVLHSYGEASAGAVKDINSHHSTIVHLHWICNFLSLEDIANIEKPIVWTLHDMWAFCGSEHYVFNENEIYFNANASAATVDKRSLQTWHKKMELWKNKKFVVIAPSHWLALYAKKSALMKNCDVHIIPYPIDIESWKARPKVKARAQFNFNSHKKYLLFIAKNPLNDLNKGWDLLQDTLLKLHEKNAIDFELVVVGHTGEIKVSLPFKIHSLGDINNDEILTQIYSAVDVLVVPSRAEAFSQVTLEAQACALPAVGFEVGAIPDIIIHQSSGWVAKPFNTNDFCTGIQWVLSNENRYRLLSEHARKNVITKFSPEVIAKQYAKLYEDMARDISL